MAAALNALNNYLQNTLLITSDAVRQAINHQGIEALNDFATLTETDITEICTNVRKPGSTMPNPMHDPNNVVPGIPPTIANPGVTLGHVHEKHLKALCYYIYHLTRIQQPLTLNAAMLDRITALYQHKEQQDEYNNDIALPAKLASVDNIRIASEDLDKYLLRK